MMTLHFDGDAVTQMKGRLRLCGFASQMSEVGQWGSNQGRWLSSFDSLAQAYTFQLPLSGFNPLVLSPPPHVECKPFSLSLKLLPGEC